MIASDDDESIVSQLHCIEKMKQSRYLVIIVPERIVVSVANDMCFPFWVPRK
jgi:hypothetical protein